MSGRNKAFLVSLAVAFSLVIGAPIISAMAASMAVAPGDGPAGMEKAPADMPSAALCPAMTGGAPCHLTKSDCGAGMEASVFTFDLDAAARRVPLGFLSPPGEGPRSGWLTGIEPDPPKPVSSI